MLKSQVQRTFEHRSNVATRAEWLTKALSDSSFSFNAELAFS
ncbi:MAG TPA: hypothetical protein VHW01_25460 [Polyangiaceae bacterium]|jgi:hypothetical protein|nr:hypothetical protein [Polyangiaceae bacterium]